MDKSSEQIQEDFRRMFGSASILQVVISFLLAFYFSVWFHEMGHAITFMRLGVAIRGVIVLGVSCVRRNRKWSIRFKPSLLKMMGGIAVPEIREIYSEDELTLMQDKFARAILSGPIMSVIYTIGLVLITILLFLLGYDVAFMIWFSIFTGIILILVLLSSDMENELMVGDFKAYGRARKDPFFVAQMMYQYKYFSEREDVDQKYLREYLLKALEKKLEAGDTHLYTLSIVDLLLMEGLSDGHIPQVIKDYVSLVSEDIFLVKKLIALEGVKNLIYHMAAFYKIIGDDRADMLYDVIKHNRRKGSVDTYLFDQVSFVFNSSDGETFLKAMEKVEFSSLQVLYNQFEGFMRLEKSYNDLLLKKCV